MAAEVPNNPFAGAGRDNDRPAVGPILVGGGGNIRSREQLGIFCNRTLVEVVEGPNPLSVSGWYSQHVDGSGAILTNEAKTATVDYNNVRGLGMLLLGDMSYLDEAAVASLISQSVIAEQPAPPPQGEAPPPVPIRVLRLRRAVQAGPLPLPMQPGNCVNYLTRKVPQDGTVAAQREKTLIDGVVGLCALGDALNSVQTANPNANTDSFVQLFAAVATTHIDPNEPELPQGLSQFMFKGRYVNSDTNVLVLAVGEITYTVWLSAPSKFWELIAARFINAITAHRNLAVLTNTGSVHKALMLLTGNNVEKE